MQLRAYRAEDWPAVCQIYDLSKPDELGGLVQSASIASLSVDEKMQSLFCESQVVVMEDRDRVVGFCGNRQSFITWLFVHPEFRRRGVASALIGDMVARLSDPITLNVMANNLAARALYEQMGFKVEREFQGTFQGTPCEVARLRHTAA